MDADALGRVGTALADPTRRRLLLRLVDGPAYPSDLADALSLTRGNVSNHLSCLRGCGLVSTVHVGRRVRYELADPRLSPEVMAVRAMLDGWRFYDQLRTDAAAPARGTHLATRSPVLSPDGASLAATLATAPAESTPWVT